MSNENPIPMMQVGRYAGTQVDKLPNSYLRWMIGQGFSPEILAAAKKKLEQSEFNDLHMNVTRHAIDMFSKRFIEVWIQGKHEDVGLATFIALYAQRAWEHGIDMSKHRHKDDGIIKEYEHILWVFNVNEAFPDYKDLITVMPSGEQ